MTLDDRSILSRLGSGEQVDYVKKAAGLNDKKFEEWWDDQLKSRVPDMQGSRKIDGQGKVEILRDELGTPHIYADTAEDLFFGYGFAMGQDRLWQLDYLRRKALGQLSEVLGHEGIDNDVVARTVGINRIAASEIDRIPSDTKQMLDSFSLGINTAMEESRECLPIEFGLLDYEPETWKSTDSIAIWAEFRWYLTGRLPIIAFPEMTRRTLGEGPLYQAFLLGEAEDETIVPPGHYPPEQSGGEAVGEVVSDPEEGLGSNNWVIGGSLSDSGLPILASDPHIAFGSVSCWYQAHLAGAGFNVIGAGYAGVPGIIFGRNERVAWGLTNNICAQRDLYQEKENPDKPGHFLYDGKWEESKELIEEINVRGEKTIAKKIIITRNGPLADEIVPPIARDSGPVSLRWMGHEPCDEITSLLNVNKSSTAKELRAALQTWVVPTWSFGFADIDGHFGYQSVGKIPIKENWGRGYRPGWDPDHQWNETIPYQAMPSMENPDQGWIRSANNRLAPDDFPYPLSGVWSSGHRAKRIRQMIEDKNQMTREDVADMQLDSVSLRAIEGVPGLVKTLEPVTDQRIQAAIQYLRDWDRLMEPDRVGAAIFESFFYFWGLKAAAERFEPDQANVLGTAMAGLSLNLLNGDNHSWFVNNDRNHAILEAMNEALDDLENRVGKDMSTWTWGAIHKVQLSHQLASRGEIFKSLSRGGNPVRGNGITVCNTGFDPTYLAGVGANYRITAELSDNPPGLWSVDTAGQSGHPGSNNYCDQLDTWLQGHHNYLPLDRERVEKKSITRFTINI